MTKKIMKYAKDDLVNETMEIAEAQGARFLKKDVEFMLGCILEGVKSSLGHGHNVELRGFGAFKVKAVPARMARNPKTGASVKVAAHRRVSFKASKDLVA